LVVWKVPTELADLWVACVCWVVVGALFPVLNRWLYRVKRQKMGGFRDFQETGCFLVALVVALLPVL
jgi:hypothetical protein